MIVRGMSAREVLSTSGRTTVEIEIATDKGVVRVSAPIGTSRGRHEVSILPPEEVIRRFLIIRRNFTFKDFDSQEQVDNQLREIDRTRMFSEIGGNLAIAISSAFMKAFALERGLSIYRYVSEAYGTSPSLPIPISNVAGGWHGDSGFQEFELIPLHQETFLDSMKILSSSYLKLGKMIRSSDRTFSGGKNMESGWATSLGIEKILEMMASVAKESNLRIGVDVAASQLWDGKEYVYPNGNRLNTHDQIYYIDKLCRTFPIAYVEDPFHEEDFSSHSLLTDRIRPKLVCGDDLYSTDSTRLTIGWEKKSTSAAIIKPSQIGTITDAVEFFKQASDKKIKTVMSHRSGETDDSMLSHLAVGLGCDYVKFGISGERIFKLNEIIRIEEKLGKS